MDVYGYIAKNTQCSLVIVKIPVYREEDRLQALFLPAQNTCIP